MPKAKPRQHHAPQSFLSPSQIPEHLYQQPQYPTQYSTEQYNPQASQYQAYYQTRTNDSLNLQVLQRLNPRIRRILFIAPFAVVYTFSQSTAADKKPGWEKTGVEGTLFIVELDDHDGLDRYGVLVLNRKGLDNFEMELRSAEDVEVSGEYIILQSQNENEEGMGIIGLWIFASNSEAAGEAGATKEGEDLRGLVARVITESAALAEASRRHLQRPLGAAYAGMAYDGTQDEEEGGADVLQTLFARARSGQHEH